MMDQCKYVFKNGKRCQRPRRHEHYCDAHHYRYYNGRDMDKPIRPFKSKNKNKDSNGFGRCSHVFKNGTQCPKPECSSGLCNTHYKRKKTGVDMDKPFKNQPKKDPSWDEIMAFSKSVSDHRTKEIRKKYLENEKLGNLGVDEQDEWE